MIRERISVDVPKGMKKDIQKIVKENKIDSPSSYIRRVLNDAIDRDMLLIKYRSSVKK